MFDYDTSKRMFWKVGEDVFYNKIDALTKSIETDLPLDFHMFEEVFDVFDWEQEPKETWESILCQRAQQLRDVYSYLRLWYSGGADSHTILLTFIKNNIPLDEIIMMRHSPYDDFTTTNDKEVNDVALSFIKTMENQLDKTKITILDVGSKEYEEYSKRDFHSTGSFKFKPFSFRELQRLMPQQLEVSGLSCEIRGHDKPRLFMEDNMFYSGMYDATNAFNTVGDHHLECFYTTDAMPKLHIKQAHMFKNHLKNYYKVRTAADLSRVEKENYALKAHVNDSCRYPLWKQITVGKGNSFALPHKELLLREDTKKHNPVVYGRYMGMMRNQENSPLRVRCNDNDIFKGFIGVISKKYCLGV